MNSQDPSFPVGAPSSFYSDFSGKRRINGPPELDASQLVVRIDIESGAGSD